MYQVGGPQGAHPKEMLNGKQARKYSCSEILQIPSLQMEVVWMDEIHVAPPKKAFLKPLLVGIYIFTASSSLQGVLGGAKWNFVRPQYGKGVLLEGSSFQSREMYSLQPE